LLSPGVRIISLNHFLA